MSSKRKGQGDDNGGDENAIVTLAADSEYYTPVEIPQMRAHAKDDKVHGQTGIKEMRVHHIQIESSVMQVEETRPRLLEVWREGGKVDVGRNAIEGGDTSRRTSSSSSSLADILNPMEEPLVIPAHQSPKDMSTTIPLTKTLPDPQLQLVTSQVDSSQAMTTIATGNDAENDEEMMDIVGINEEAEGTDATAMKDVITDNISTRPSGSTDSQQTIEEPVTNLPQPTDTKLPLPSRTPSPSKKRKYTPESSPDEPLSHELQLQRLPTHFDTEIQPQISVEKPKAGSRVVKTSRLPIKHPQPRPGKVAKKKPKINGEKKKPGLNPKEKSASVGLDDVYLSRITILIIVHINTSVQRYPIHRIILILREFWSKFETTLLYLS